MSEPLILRRIRLPLALLLVLFLCVASARAGEEKPGKTIYFLVHSGACPCQKEQCQLAAPIAGRIQANRVKGVDYRKLDYGQDPNLVQPLVRQYKLVMFPVLLVVDAIGVELFKAVGRIDPDATWTKLVELGVVKAEAGK